MKDIKYNIFIWLYRTFCYFVPGGLALWLFLIENLIDKEVSTFQKISCSGIFILILIVCIAVYFYGKHFDKTIQKITNEILECLDDSKKTELISKKRKIEAKQDIFKNACFIAPFIIMWLLCCVIEKGIISLRGTLMTISISMASGLGFNSIAQAIKCKSK